MPNPESSDIAKATLNSETNFISNTVLRYAPGFAIFASKWGINESASLPVVSVVTAVWHPELEAKLMEYYSPYRHEIFPIRFGIGNIIVPAGRVWYYPRTPITSSISTDTDPPEGGT